MKAAFVLLFVFCAVECRKIAPVNKSANVDFINMERGGMGQPQPKAPAAAPTPAPAASSPTTKATPPPIAKPAPAPTPVPVKPQPTQQPHQIKPAPVNPKPVVNTITTPGPGSVKSLVNFYDSRGNASPIRPYSYSQAVKQG